MLAAALLAAVLSAPPPAVPAPPRALAAAADRARKALVARHGDRERARAERGVAQVAAFWRPSDGAARAFEAFCAEHFLPRGQDLDATFARLEASLEAIDGHSVEINRELSRFAQLDLGPMLPVDGLLAAHDAAAHVTDDLFEGSSLTRYHGSPVGPSSIASTRCTDP